MPNMAKLNSRQVSILRCLMRFCLVSALSFLSFYLAKRKLMNRLRKKLPPGPWGVPILGILPFLRDDNPASKAKELSNIYGSVFGGYLGGMYTVFLNDYDTIVEAFGRKNDVMTDRPKILPFNHFIKGHGLASGFIHNNWKGKRRFFMTAMNRFDVGKPHGHVATTVEDEIGQMMKEIAIRGQEHDIAGMLMIFTGNIVARLTLGMRFDYTDEDIQKCFDKVVEMFAISDPANPTVFFDCAKYLPWTNNRRFIDYNKELQDYFEMLVRKGKDSLGDGKPSGQADNMMEMYLKKFGNPETGELPHDKADEFFHLFADLMAAGTDTTASNTLWLLLCVIKYPDVQGKIQAELDSAVGFDGIPTLSDRGRLPYTEAVSWESRRFCIAGPFSVPHASVADTEINGYFIPKDTMVIANAWAVSRDPKLFPDPETFRPERFLDENGKLVVTDKVQSTIFGFGRRTCAGRPLALSEMFIILSRILHRYNLKIKGGPETVSLLPERGLATRPHPYKIIFEPRKLQ